MTDMIARKMKLDRATFSNMQASYNSAGHISIRLFNRESQTLVEASKGEDLIINLSMEETNRLIRFIKQNIADVIRRPKGD
jgi:hypothetical protein